MASSLSNLVNNFTERINKTKRKIVFEYDRVKDNLIK